MKAALRVAIAIAGLTALRANAQTITVTISSDLLGATLSGSGTTAAALSMGLISKGGAAPSGMTLTKTATSWTLSTPFDVTVTKDLTLVSVTYTLQAQLSTSDSSRTWSVNSLPLNALAPVTLTTIGAYAVPESQTFTLQIPDGAPPGALSNTIVVTAISN